MLEARVAALESDMREVRASLGRIERVLEKLDERARRVELDVAELKGRVANLPSTWTVLTAVFGMAFAVPGLVFAVIRLATP